MTKWIMPAIVGLALMVMVLVQMAGMLDDPPAPLNDPAIRNIVTLISGFILGLTGWIWFCFVSHYSSWLRMSVAVATLLVIVALFGLKFTLGEKRWLTFSGSLLPRLASTDRPPDALDKARMSNRADFHTAFPVDFLQFLGPNRQGWISTTQLSREWDSHKPQTVWTRSIGAGWSGFAATENYAVTMEQRDAEEWVVCYEVATGQTVWGHAIPAQHDTALGGTGPRSTPTIHQGYVYALGATGVLRCLDESGQLVWSENLRERYGVTDAEDEEHVMFGRAASPLVFDALVVVPGGGPQGRAKNLVAFDRLDGHVVWESESQLPNGQADQIAYASPTLATVAGRRQILIVNESTASGHDPSTGHRLWAHSWPGRSNGNASVSQPVAVGDQRVLLTKGYGEGAELLELKANEDHSLSISSLWKVSRVLQTKFSNVVVYRGHVYGLSEGILECVELETGKRRWKKGRYGHGQILGVNDLLLVMSEDGHLNLVELNSDKFNELAKHPLLDGKSWNNLCLIGKRLLARNAEQAICVDLP